MRRLNIVLGSFAVLLAVLLPAAMAQAAPIPPRITWSGITVNPTGSTTCEIPSQTVTFTVKDLTGNSKDAWTVSASGENTGVVVITLPLGTVTRADNGATESVHVGPKSVTTGTGQITFFVKLFDPSGTAVDTVLQSGQTC